MIIVSKKTAMGIYVVTRTLGFASGFLAGTWSDRDSFILLNQLLIPFLFCFVFGQGNYVVGDFDKKLLERLEEV